MNGKVMTLIFFELYTEYRVFPTGGSPPTNQKYATYPLTPGKTPHVDSHQSNFYFSSSKVNSFPPPLNNNFHVISYKNFIFSCCHCSCTIFILTSYFLYTGVMLILILIDAQYLQNIVFSFEKGSNGQIDFSSGFHHPIKNPPAKFPIPPPTPECYLENHGVYKKLGQFFFHTYLLYVLGCWKKTGLACKALNKDTIVMLKVINI